MRTNRDLYKGIEGLNHSFRDTATFASPEAALSIAKACPFLDIGGSLEVSELVKMPD